MSAQRRRVSMKPVEAVSLSTDDMMHEIKREEEMAKLLNGSCDHWARIVATMSESILEMVESENEYKIRLETTRAYNQMLEKQIVALKAEISDQKGGVRRMPSRIDSRTTQTSKKGKIVLREWQLEICSLTSLLSMYERQLDQEAAAHQAARENCHQIINDIRFQQATELQELEEQDKELFRTFSKPSNLGSYLRKQKVADATVWPSIKRVLAAYRAYTGGNTSQMLNKIGNNSSYAKSYQRRKSSARRPSLLPIPNTKKRGKWKIPET